MSTSRVPRGVHSFFHLFSFCLGLLSQSGFFFCHERPVPRRAADMLSSISASLLIALSLITVHKSQDQASMMRNRRLGLTRCKRRQFWAVMATSGGLPRLMKATPPAARLNILHSLRDRRSEQTFATIRTIPESSLYGSRDSRPICQSLQIVLASNRPPRNSGDVLLMVFALCSHVIVYIG